MGAEGASSGSTVTVPESQATILSRQVVPGRILVQYRKEVKGDKAKRIIATAGGKEITKIDPLGVSVVDLPEGVDGEVQVKALAACPEVAFAELDPVAAPDVTTVDDPYYPREWHLSAIEAPTAWDISLGNDAVIIAILDTGVNSQHVDLAAKIVPGWNTYDNNVNTDDVNGHGTAVAGSAAACSNNGVGVAAPAANCRIMPMRISDMTGLGYGSTVAAALVWAADNGARVANVSFRFDFSLTVSSAAQYFVSKGGVVTMSAGNEGSYLSATDNPYILTIGATDSSDGLATFTNTGANIDLVAPGISIFTTTRDGGYASWAGTSFSAPITAGVAALVISAKPSLTGVQVQDILEQSADDFGTTGYDTGFGWGRLNAAKALALATSTSNADSVAPKVSISSPVMGTTYTGKLAAISVTAKSSDNVAVTKVGLYVDGTLVNTSTKSPFTTVWSPGVSANGNSHTLMCKAYDAAGNVGVSSSVSVSLDFDTTAPMIAIKTPVSGSIITTGKTSVTVDASDNLAVTQVELYVDNVLFATSTAAPFTLTWNPGEENDGVHTLVCKAYDAAANVTASSAVSVTQKYDNVVPVISVNSPLSGDLVDGTVNVTVSVTDNVKVKKVQLVVDGKYVGQNLAYPYTNVWDASTATNGSHTLFCKAFDDNGNIATSQTITVSVGTDVVVPIVAITSPLAGSAFDGKCSSIPVMVSASDNEGVTKVECYVDGVLTDTATELPFTTTWSPDVAANGKAHTLMCKAYDEAGNVGVSKSVSVLLDFDTTAPIIAIKTPVSDSVITTGKTSVTVAASDNLAVTRVELYVDSVLFSTSTTSPFTFTWDPGEDNDGVRVLICKAYDAAGNVTASPAVSVTLKYDNIAPAIAIISPISGTLVNGMVNVTVAATDNVKVKKVQLVVDGKYIGQNLAYPYTNVWNSSTATAGTHTIFCKAFDDNGNIGVSKTVTVKK